VADVARLPGLFEQVWLVSGLRWRILRNNMKNKNRVWDIIGVVISSLVGIVFVAGLAMAIFVGTVSFLNNHHETRFALLFWGIFLWWQVLPIFVAGFSPSFSFRSLLRFPLKFSTFYLMGIAYGLADSAALASIFWMITMILATAMTKLSFAPVMILASAFFIAVNVTLERLIGSWVEKILSKRKAREFFLAIFVLLMVGVQFIGPAVQKYEKSATPDVERIVRYARPFPGSLAGDMIAGAASGDLAAAGKGAAGLAGYALLLGGLLLFRYREQFRGEELSETLAPARVAAKSTVVARETFRPELGILPATVAAVLAKEFRYLFRNGFVATALLFPPMLVLLFSMQFGGAHPTTVKHAISPDLFFPGMMAYLTLMLMAPSFNSFAYEGRGMQTYFMLPVRFRDILLAKNFVTVTILTTEIALCIALLKWRVGLPPLPAFLATIGALIFAVVGQLTIANWSSLKFPKKMEFGKMQGNRQSGMAVLIAFGAQLVFGSTCGLVLFVGRAGSNPWLSMEIFLFLAAAAVAGYVAALDPLTRLAEDKKESILDTLMK
jgi:ABC-2 type transport system permease protein